MLFSILLIGFSSLLTMVVAAGRIDSADEFLMALRMDRVNAVYLAFAVFLFVATLPRPAIRRRLGLAVLVGVVCWVATWRFLVHCDYTQLRVRGVDPDAIVQGAK